MINNDKFRRMKERNRVYTGLGLLINVVGNVPKVRKNKELSGALTVAGCTISVASMVNYFRSLEKYDMEEDDEEVDFWINHFVDFSLPAICNSLLLGWSLSSDEYKREKLKKLNVPTDIINKLV